MKFYRFIAAFLFFLKDKRLKKLVVPLNSDLFYQYFLLVLFACKDPSPLYKFSKRMNHLKP